MTVAAPMQRVKGEGRISVKLAAGRTRLDRLHQEGSAKIRLPEPHGREGLEAVFINTAGGMTGGDRLCWRAEAPAGTGLTLTTQACEKAYRSTGDRADIAVRLTAGNGARLEWLPQETILYEASVLSRRLDIDLAPTATLVLCEAILFGRAAMGETVREARFRDCWRIRAGDRLVHAEETRIDSAALSKGSESVLFDGGAGIATLLLVGPQSGAFAAPLRAALAGIAGLTAGVSHVELHGTGKLLARLVAGDGLTLRRGLIAGLAVLNLQAGLPKVWRL